MKDEDETKEQLLSEPERRRVEEMLRASEENLRKTLDNLLEGCQIISFDWRYLYLNDAAAGHGRSTKEALLGNTMMEMYPGIEKTEMFSVLQKCMKERVLAYLENEFTFPDGGRGWFELRIQPVPAGIFILSIDITERKRAQEALRQSEERFRLLATHARDMIYRICLKPEFGFEYVSPSVTEITGYASEECYADPGFALKAVHPHDQRTFEAWVKSPEQYSEPLSLRVIRKDGDIVWCEFQNVPIYDGAGNVVAVEGIGRNITERKRSEELLEKKLIELQAVNQFNVKLANDRAELIKKMEHRVDQLGRLYLIGKKICTSNSLGECLPDIASHLSEVLPSTLTTIVMIEAEGTLSVSAEMGKSSVSFQERARARGLTHAVIASGSMLYVPDYPADPRSNPALVAEGIKSWVGIPLVVEGKVRGVLIARSRQEDAFVDDMDILEAFAQWTIQAIRFLEPSWAGLGKPRKQSGRRID